MIDLYKDNWKLIQDFKRINCKKINFFNFKINNNNLNEVIKREDFDQIYESQSCAFKITCSLGLVLYNTDDSSIYYHYASDHNNPLLADAVFIKNTKDFIKFKKILKDLDPASLIREQYHTILLRICNICFFVYKLNFALGGYLCGCDFPLTIKRNQYLLNFKSKNNCFFACLAYHKLFQKYQNSKVHLQASFGKEMRRLLSSFQKKFGKKENVTLQIMRKLELLFKVKINIYTYDDKNNIISLYNSAIDMPGAPMRLMMTSCPEHHFGHVSYITKWENFSKIFVCQTCNTVLKNSRCLKSHYSRSTPCNVTTKMNYPSGIFKPTRDVWEKIGDKYNIVFESVPSNDYFVVFDFECMLRKKNIKKRKTTYTQKHVPISYSLCSNIPGYTEPICKIRNNSEKNFIQEFVKRLNQISDKAYHILLDKYRFYLQKVAGVCDADSKILDEVDKYFRILPVISFNGKSYDIPIIRNSLFKCLKSPFVIKQNSNYLTIVTSKLQFLDITSYIAPNTSYRSFLDALQIPIKKGFFPYSYLSSKRVLRKTKLPARKHFFDDLNDKELSIQDYNLCLKAWKENNMQTFADYLMYYNNLDTGPFVLAIQKMIDILKKRNISPFKDAISLPGISQKLLFQNCKDSFELSGSKDIHDLLTSGLIGGPAIIFLRYAFANETFIKPYRYAKPVLTQRILGYDCNSLYLRCLGEKMPTGPFLYRTVDSTGKYLQKTDRIKYTKEIQWLLLLEKELNINIQTQLSPKGQKQFGDYKVDGYFYNEKTRTHIVWEFLGCYFHSHQSSLCNIAKYSDIQNYRNTMKRLEILKSYPNTQVFHIWECEYEEFLKAPLKIKPNITRQQCLDSILPKTIRTGCRIHVSKLLDMILADEIFGVIQCSVSVTPSFRSFFDDFPPLFKNAEIALDDLSGLMYDYAKKHNLMAQPRRMLVSSMFCESGVFITPMIQWFLKKNIEHGDKVFSIHDIKAFIQYIPEDCFKFFCDEITKDRIAGDQNEKLKIHAYMAKNLGNSAYGKMITQVQRHKNVLYTSNDDEYFKHVASPLFVQSTDLGDDFFEVIKNKTQVSWKNPLHIGLFVYHYAKLKMLEFYYDFIKKYLKDSHYALIQMDTDSLYINLGGLTLDECVKPHLKKEFSVEKENWLVTNSTKRKPGLFKLEWSGIGYAGLNAKTYCCLGDEMKMGLKGVKKKLEYYNFESFKNVLVSEKPHFFKNKGIKLHQNKMYTYTEEKKGLDYFYCKRKVLDDGIHTVTLDV